VSEVLNHVYETIDQAHGDKPAATRRQVVAGAAAAFGTMGMLSWTDQADAQIRSNTPNTPQNILNVAATAEVLATIVNTVGLESPGIEFRGVERRNIQAASREELIHFDVLVSDAVGGSPATRRIWVPDRIFSNRNEFFTALAVGDQIFINAYLLGTTVFARAGGVTGSRFARFAAEFMGAEAVHRALALQSLGGTGNDRAFIRFTQREERPDLPTTGQPGFFNILEAVTQLQNAGFGIGKEGEKPGRFYDFDTVRQRTPDPGFVNTRTPR